jgi:hypothetical protein
MTEEEALIVRMILEQNCGIEARAVLFCDMLSQQCRTHEFRVETNAHGQWYVNVTQRTVPRQGAQP